MNTQTPIPATLRHIPITDLYLHELNPRQNGSAEDAAALADLFVNAEVQEAHGLSRAQAKALDLWLPEEMREGVV